MKDYLKQKIEIRVPSLQIGLFLDGLVLFVQGDKIELIFQDTHVYGIFAFEDGHFVNLFLRA